MLHSDISAISVRKPVTIVLHTFFKLSPERLVEMLEYRHSDDLSLVATQNTVDFSINMHVYLI